MWTWADLLDMLDLALGGFGAFGLRAALVDLPWTVWVDLALGVSGGFSLERIWWICWIWHWADFVDLALG